jgi:hypothetical protein
MQDLHTEMFQGETKLMKLRIQYEGVPKSFQKSCF